ncbi:hypothetical protein KKF61_06290 [Patescibacteria group bacterium]|nr:hypothetical protein [Patescibacteria group bacterium]MBU0963893.1 hypothetical protein [Patescibacteria group bacterium]
MPISALHVQRADDPAAAALLRRLQKLGYSDLTGLTIERVFCLEGDVDPDELKPLLVNPLYETGSALSQLADSSGPIIEVGYQPAVVDPETISILDGASALGVTELEWARLGFRYQLTGVDPSQALAIAQAYLFNPVVQRIIEPGMQWDTLQPTGQPNPVQNISLIGLGDTALIQLSEKMRWLAPLSQMKALQAEEANQGRPFTDCEHEIYIQTHCDHCEHLTWRRLGLMKRLHAATQQINHPLVKSAFGDNAGGMLFYDGWVICIKGETHCFPSATATYGGIMTKHGGILRDILGFGGGAYPIGSTTIMGIMDPRISAEQVPPGALHPMIILLESIRGTADYCNPMGIPMMLPMYRLHSHYPKCFALGHAIGIIPEKYALKDDPQNGDIILLIGGRTGRDGIHGATVSSSGMSSHTMVRDAAAVQIGHPIVERNIMTATPELRDGDCIRHITDLGAGGISCAAGESAKKSGAVIYLERVLLKDISLSGREILLSESQERMLIIVPPDKVDLAEEILRKHNVETTQLGQITNTGRFVVYHHGQKVVDLSMDFLWNSCPVDPIEIREPKRNLTPATVITPSDHDAWKRAMLQVVSHFHCSDQSPAGFQFDTTVQGRTAIGPFAGINGNMPTNVFASAPLRGHPYGAIFTAAFNTFFGEIDPAALGRLMMVEAITKAVVLGVSPLEMVLCDNVYTPSLTPEIAWDLKAMVESFIDFSVTLGIPFVSGKDSSSGTFACADGTMVDVPNTFVCATLGRVPDVRQLITKPFKQPGSRLILLGQVNANNLGGSVYLDCHGQRGDNTPDYGPDWATILLPLWQGYHAIHQHQDILSASAIAEGGLFMRLFEMALGSSNGALVNLSDISDGRLDGNLFGEHIGTILVEISHKADTQELFGDLPWREIGQVTNDQFLTFTNRRSPLAWASLAELTTAWQQTFKEVVL